MTRCAAATSSRLSRTACSRSTSVTPPTALWQAVARTYEPDASSWELRFEELKFGDDETLLERVARAEALAIAANHRGSDNSVAHMVCTKLPRDVRWLSTPSWRRVARPACMGSGGQLRVWRRFAIMSR
ncbi:hypothetical protein BAE44_0012049 [Dichanthelium oligosanthes]|uniref:Uncharacterized protein n=1 Tax=Dichanthelium oligosanthes TaxID=888268 RepID=A0A1E5VP66_9POAL|nr:hypothetical protein BAE44_0012049 [Dichanthelium oligosanthes]